jgi:peptidoglycan/xylan/chitin deacetylase (PgdA/CDA1 family)
MSKTRRVRSLELLGASQVTSVPAFELGRAARSGIRAMHAALLRRPMVNDLAIYFHELDPVHWAPFRDSIKTLFEMGYRSVTPQEFAAPGNGGKRLFVSFDDNFRCWHRALPIFADLGLKATFYVNSLPFRDTASDLEIGAYLTRLAMPPDRRTLTRAELAEIGAEGHTIGCHSHSHFVLSQLPRSMWDVEIRDSRRIIEDITGAAVDNLSWPYGMRRHFSRGLREYCMELGFKTIANGISGCQHSAGTDPMNIFRTGWRLDSPLDHNLTNLRIDGRIYAALFGRSVIG